jgi:hypothetical protein
MNKGGRPRKDADSRRDQNLHIMLTRQEIDDLFRTADRRGLSTSSFVRTLILQELEQKQQ